MPYNHLFCFSQRKRNRRGGTDTPPNATVPVVARFRSLLLAALLPAAACSSGCLLDTRTYWIGHMFCDCAYDRVRGRVYFSGGDSLDVWDLSEQRFLNEIPLPPWCEQPVLIREFACNGDSLSAAAIADLGGQSHWEFLHTPLDQPGFEWSCAPTSSRVIEVAPDGTACVKYAFGRNGDYYHQLCTIDGQTTIIEDRFNAWAFSPDGRLIAIGDGSRVSLYALPSAERLWTVECRGDPVAVETDAVYVSDEKTTREFDRTSGNLLREYKFASRALATTDTYLLVVLRGGWYAVIDRQTGRRRHLAPHPDAFWVKPFFYDEHTGVLCGSPGITTFAIWPKENAFIIYVTLPQ